ncbi:SRPBCC family protein [Paludibaculum fermentans]|uniref:SRPBCC domain-containing protein n=1 Tax=Paludibaculum fermentans TaxID=1473598 RepID=A0A7S7NUE5_PALFE|nr:SRPBCC domain-containing protein [Paludibaculum fermentans]QOY90016.1 SRPBCC domain-containing protein [Paludibaculum fermentans]
MSEGKRNLDLSVEIDATPEQVWKAISEGDQITRWFAPIARVEPGEGGKVTISWGPGMEGTAPITAWEPGKRLAWTEDHGAKGPRVVEFLIEGGAGKTTLRLVHSGFGADASFDNEYESSGGGWSSFLQLLRHDLENTRELPAQTVNKMAMIQRPPAELMAELKAALAYEETGSGQYKATLPGGASVSGAIVFQKDPGYLILGLDSIHGGTVGLFAEKWGDTTALTNTWYLKGEAAAGADTLLQGWDELTERLAKAS